MRRTIVPPLQTSPQSPALGGVVHALNGQTMGTTWSVKLVADTARDTTTLHNAIQHQLNRVVAQMSTWEDASDLSRFNQASADSWHTLPAEFFTVLSYGLQVARASNGAYDPTAGALVNLWGFGPTGRYNEASFVPPTETQLQHARATCGWDKLQIDVASSRVRQPGGMYIDLSAIAKGFAVDQVARRLLQLGLDSFLVEVGGELRGEGIRPDGQPWWVALEQPLSPSIETTHAMETLVALYGWSIATSGDYRRYFDANDTRYSHTIDPRTGEPIRNRLASVTVLHEECMAADAWSTALGVMGEQEGLALADKLGLHALFMKRGDDNRLTEYVSAPLLALIE